MAAEAAGEGDIDDSVSMAERDPGLKDQSPSAAGNQFAQPEDANAAMTEEQMNEEHELEDKEEPHDEDEVMILEISFPFHLTGRFILISPPSSFQQCC